jgi:hypothetical protein
MGVLVKLNQCLNPAGSRVLARAMVGHVVFGDWALNYMAPIDYRTIGHQVRIRP